MATATVKKAAVKKKSTVKKAVEAVVKSVRGVKKAIENKIFSYTGGEGIPLLATMDGLSSTASYTTVAVKGITGIVAVRYFSPQSSKVKFYPNLRAWSITPEDMTKMGFSSYLGRIWYERYYGNDESLKKLLAKLNKKDKKTSPLRSRFNVAAIRVAFNRFNKVA